MTDTHNTYTFNSAGISSPPLFMTCNEASDAYEGFSFEGYEPGVYWRGNKMTNLARGMVLKNGGVIGQQGSQTGTPSDNEWLGSAWTSTNYGIYTSVSQATNSPIVRWTSPAQYDPPNLSGNPPSSSYAGGNGLITYSGSTPYACVINYTQMPSIMVPDEQDYESEDVLYMAQIAVFKSLHHNTDLRDAHSEYIDFHDLFEGSVMETLAEIETALTTGDLATAESLMAGLDTEDFNFIETNYFSFYELAISFFNSGSLTESEQNSLNSLCELCPGTDGACVFQARALYQLFNGEPFEAEACIGDEGSRKAFHPEPASQQNIGRLKVTIHPNPSSDAVSLSLNKICIGLHVRVMDLGGRVVLEKIFTEKSSYFHLNFSLDPGVYFFSISSGYENETKKVVVSQ